MHQGFKGLACVAFVSCLVAQPPASGPGTSLNPLPFSRARLTTAVSAQELPNTPVLDRAWNLYQKWQGAWQPNHPKPTPAEMQAVQEFTASLLAKLPELAASERVETAKVDLARFEQMLVVGSPAFKDSLQTPGTQTLKALAIMGLAEHELDLKEGVEIAHPLLVKLLARTPLDADLYFLYARLSLDARQNGAAWQAARTGLFMRPKPTDGDLDFVGFVGAVVVKDQWPAAQQMFQEVAVDADQATRAIERMKVIYGDQAKSIFTPMSPEEKKH